MAKTAYSQIREVYITNFMSLRSAHVVFDDSNIIKILGYNDIGKSAVLRALAVALLNKWPQKQKAFISDDTRYFQIDVVFSDDVTLRYEKHDAGTSMYEMYEGNELLFTTRLADGVYDKVVGVPQMVSEYLGLINTPDGINLNYGINTDKQLLVETKGSENYKAINIVLRSEEIYKAVGSLNSNNNVLQTNINQMTFESSGFVQQLDELKGIDQKLLKVISEFSDTVEAQEHLVGGIESLSEAIQTVENVEVIPSVEEYVVDEGLSVDIETVLDSITSLEGIDVPPEVTEVSLGLVPEIESLLGEIEVYDTVKPGPPSVDLIDETDSVAALNDLLNFEGTISKYIEVDTAAKKTDLDLKSVREENAALAAELQSQGEALTTCPNCGELHLADVS